MKKQDRFFDIARTHLNRGIDTLATRNSDDLDFYEVPVWGIRKALEAAYQAGFDAGQKGNK